MNSKKFKELLQKLNACKDAITWCEGKTWEEVYSTCHRGDWLLWLHSKTNKQDIRVRTLVKGHIANTVRHLMKDDRSIRAVDVAISFGEGIATKEELDAAYDYAVNAANDATYDAYPAYAAAYTACDTYVTATYTADAYAIGREKSLYNSAEIFKKHIKITDFNFN